MRRRLLTGEKPTSRMKPQQEGVLGRLLLAVGAPLIMAMLCMLVMLIVFWAHKGDELLSGGKSEL